MKARFPSACTNRGRNAQGNIIVAHGGTSLFKHFMALNHIRAFWHKPPFQNLHKIHIILATPAFCVASGFYMC